MNDIQRIADHYGFEKQAVILIEELSELTKETCKLLRDDTSISGREIIEEIADVEIMLEQIVYLLNCREGVNRMRRRKIDRTLDRAGLERRLKDIE